MIHNYQNYNTTDVFNEVLSQLKDFNKHETTYTEADLVSFGNYLLSESRRNAFRQMPIKGTPLAYRLKHVHDADLQNWKEKKTSVQ